MVKNYMWMWKNYMRMWKNIYYLRGIENGEQIDASKEETEKCKRSYTKYIKERNSSEEEHTYKLKRLALAFFFFYKETFKNSISIQEQGEKLLKKKKCQRVLNLFICTLNARGQWNEDFRRKHCDPGIYTRLSLFTKAMEKYVIASKVSFKPSWVIGRYSKIELKNKKPIIRGGSSNN